MRIIQGLTEFNIEGKSAVAIGKFDGMHLGHRKLIDEILRSREQGILAVIFTFEPSPEAYFAGRTLKGLMSRDEKREAFDKLGIDVLIEFPMNAETVVTPPGLFIKDYLAGRLNAAVIAAGTDISFGDKGAGDAGLLKRMADVYGYRAHIIDKVTFEGKEISSTLIRELLVNGDIDKVAALLDEPYSVSGMVLHGRRLGRELGMPTANIAPPEEKLLPPAGVYYSYSYLDGVKYNSISNIGCKPTVASEQTTGVETYLYDYDGYAYGHKLKVELLGFKRPEMKFESVEALKAQMADDIRAGRQFHKKRQ